MVSPQTCVAVKTENPEEGKILGDRRGAHAKNQLRSKNGRFCRSIEGEVASSVDLGSASGSGEKRGNVAASGGNGSASGGKLKCGKVPGSGGGGSASGGVAKGGKVAASVGVSSASGSGVKRGKGAVSVCAGSASGGRVKRGKAAACDGAGSPSDDKCVLHPHASNPASSRHPFKIYGFMHPVSEPEMKKLKGVFNSNKQISEMIHVNSSSSSDVYYCENAESSFELDECFGPQLSTSVQKNTACESSE